jgi:predicted nuclease of predicted toxin-antitoxin system
VTPRFLIDAQLPPALAERLAAAGFEASHVDRIGLGGASDLAIWRQAPALADALITKDIDFVQLARSDAAGVAVIWIRIGNVTNAALWRVLEPALPEIVAALQASERIVEIR